MTEISRAITISIGPQKWLCAEMNNHFALMDIHFATNVKKQFEEIQVDGSVSRVTRNKPSGQSGVVDGGLRNQ
jgi:hypothetical protein